MKRTTNVAGLLSLLLPSLIGGCVKVVVEQPAPKSSAAPTTDAKETSQAPPIVTLASKDATPAPPTAGPKPSTAADPPTATTSTSMPASDTKSTGTPTTADTKDPQSKAKPPELTKVSLKNAKALVREAATPVFLMLYHGEHLRPKLQEQLDLFASESKKYPKGLVFFLLDLDTKDGADIANVLTASCSERLRKQLTNDQGSGFLFYFPGSNEHSLITYGNAPEGFVLAGLTDKALEAFVYKYCSLKPVESAVPE
jgi:hypothetical protein